MYRIIKPIICFALHEFFSRIDVRGTPRESGPLLAVGNHQNFALDSLLISACFKRDLWYLGKATLFSSKLSAAVLTSLHVAPLYRRQDDPSQMTKNEETFAATAALLRAGRGVVLFPEGVSLGERKLQPIKTGAARMALLAEEQAHGEGRVLIQPVGITYSDPDVFRSYATLSFGEPIAAAAFLQEGRDPQENVRLLTETIAEGLRAVTVDLESREESELVEKIAKLYRSRGTALDDRERFALIAQNIRALDGEIGERKQEIARRIDEYLDVCSMFLFDGDVPLPDSVLLREKLLLTLAAPLIVLGGVLFFLPYRMIGVYARRAQHPVYVASVKFFSGLVLFPIWIAVLSVLVGIWCGVTTGVAFFALSAFAGWTVNRLGTRFRRLLLGLLWPGETTPVALLRARRDQLIAELEALRVV